MLKNERAFKQELCLLLVPLVGLILGWQIQWLIILIGINIIILSVESVNTAVEKLCNFIHKEKHSEIKIIKDCAASAILLLIILWFIALVLAIWN